MATAIGFAAPFLGETAARAEEEGLPTGSKPPALAVTTLAGVKLDLEGQAGKVVLVDFWATWCGPCRYAIPVIQGLHEQYAEKGLVVLGISNERAEVVRKFVGQNKMTYNIAADPAYGDIMRRYRVRGIPTLVAVDRKGILRMYEIGFGRDSGAKLGAVVQKLIAETA